MRVAPTENGLFSNGDGQRILGTPVTAEFLNSVTQELVSILTEAGIEILPTKNNQILDAIIHIIADKITKSAPSAASSDVAGIAKLVDRVDSNSKTAALTAAMGKWLADNRMSCVSEVVGEYDPNVTEKSFMLTTHANKPIDSNVNCYIMTWFYRRQGTSRFQIAVDYLGPTTLAPKMWIRHSYSDTNEWSIWHRIDTTDFSSVRDKPSSVVGYGIFDAITQKQTDWKKRKAHSYCLSTAATNLYAEDRYLPSYMNKFAVVTGNSGTTGLVVKSKPATTVSLVMPYVVLIGDSIAEGHPDLHGRLHANGAASYDNTYVSQQGQLSYELSKLLNCAVINQGIGSQTSAQVKARWERDVLAKTVNVGDGLGNNTLPFGGKLPRAVWLHIGINDVFGDVSVENIINNFNYFAQSCQDNNILLIVDNIGSHALFNESRIAIANKVNQYLAGEYLVKYPNVQVIDYWQWSTGGTGLWTNLRAECFKDNVHPNRAGYCDFAYFAYKTLQMPMKLVNLTVNSNHLGMNASNRCTKYTIGTEVFTATDTPINELNYHHKNGDSPLVTMVLDSFVEVNETKYMPFAEIYCQFA